MVIGNIVNKIFFIAFISIFLLFKVSLKNDYIDKEEKRKKERGKGEKQAKLV